MFERHAYHDVKIQIIDDVMFGKQTKLKNNDEALADFYCLCVFSCMVYNMAFQMMHIQF